MIEWESDIGKALARGKAEQKPVLLEFFSTECIGCQQLDVVTYQELEVSNFIIDRMVAMRVPVGAKSLAADFRVVWTPTLIVLDYYGKEHQRTVGFLPPEEMVAWLLLGMGKVSFDQDQFNEAGIQLNTLLNGYPDSASAPEAVYLRGVARYKSSHAAEALKDAYRQLAATYPGNEWTKRAKPFTLL